MAALTRGEEGRPLLGKTAEAAARAGYAAGEGARRHVVLAVAASLGRDNVVDYFRGHDARHARHCQLRLLQRRRRSANAKCSIVS